MKHLRFFIILLLVVISLQAKADRAMYVDGFATILGNITAEDELLSYAQTHGIETLLLYELHIVNTNHDLPNPTTNHILADFIRKAKTSYGILNMGATAENGNFFTDIIDAYNNSRTDPLEKFDVYNLEFEYWINSVTGPGGYYCDTYLTPNGLPCTEDGAFQFYVSVMETMTTLADNNTHPITTEAYVGWPTAGQADTIGANLDRVRVHAYITNPNTAFDYSENRLIDFANGNPGLDISIIFSSEPNFMQHWLENNSMLSAENIYTTDWNSGSAGWSNNINLDGFTYYTYSNMTNVSLPVELSYFKGEPTDKGILLNWETLSETDSDYFELERQHTNLNGFNVLGEIPSTGNSLSAIQYKFFDSKPNSGVNYYRLKQVDYDGKFNYSKTIAISYHDEFKGIRVYPSLAEDFLYIELREKMGHIFICDTNGQRIKEIKVVDRMVTKININDLTSGVYLLIIESDSQFESFRFIKQN